MRAPLSRPLQASAMTRTALLFSRTNRTEFDDDHSGIPDREAPQRFVSRQGLDSSPSIVSRGSAAAFAGMTSVLFATGSKPVPAGFGCLENVQRASRLIPRSRLLSGTVGFDGRLMKNFSISAAILFTATLGVCAASAQAQGDKPTIVRLDPALDALVSPDAKLQLVKSGFGFTEGIIWVEQGRYLLLSDIPANVIYKLTPKGEVYIYMHRSGYTQPDIWRVGFEQTNGKDPGDPLFEKFYMIGSNGLALDRQGRLIIATWAGRSIDRIEKDGKRTILADRFDGKQFNGPNDVIVKRNGTIYFTDTYGGLRLREKDPRKGLDFQGVYMIKGGSVRRIIDDIPNPNGLALSPEGRHLGTILTPELVANVEFGDPDHKTLYIAARTSVYKIRVNTAGIP